MKQRTASSITVAPPFYGSPYLMVEYAFYGCIFYGLMGPALGISINLLGAGSLALLAVFCLVRAGKQSKIVYSQLFFPIAVIVAFLAIQVFVHGESLGGLLHFVSWAFLLIITAALALRKDFLKRSVIALFLIGTCCLPFLTLAQERVGLDQEAQIGIRNPNDLAAYFGWCAVGLAILGLETSGGLRRMACWAGSLLSLFVVMLTVSRAPILAAVAALLVAFRRSLRRTFVPLLLLTVLLFLAYASGMFDRALGKYAERGMEDTGRVAVLPIALARFFASPVFGVGVAHLPSSIAGTHDTNPHNGFIYFALGSGVIPFLLFVSYLVYALRGVRRLAAAEDSSVEVCLPLVVYVLLEIPTIDLVFMSYWAVIALSVAIHGNFLGAVPLRRRISA